VSGAVNGFKGSYKERLEGNLEALLRTLGEDADVAVDIRGPYGPTLDKLVEPQALLSAGTLGERSPIYATVREHKLSYVLIRGRHLIGPNPALAAVVGDWLKANSAARRAMDLFSGTGIASRVLLRDHPEVVVSAVDADERKTTWLARDIASARLKTITGDALSVPLDDQCDAIIADPYYEDCLGFLEKRGAEIRDRSRQLILVGGRIQHESWNDRVEAATRGCGFSVQRRALYGQMIFVGR
jgi:hypothetical protein